MGVSEKVDPYVYRGLLAAVLSLAIYVSLDDPSPVVSIVLALCLISGCIYAVSSPKRWSINTTITLYRAILLLPGIGSFISGIYYLYTVGLMIHTVSPIVLSLVFLIPLVIMPWEEVREYLAYVKDPANEVSDSVAPVPPRLFLRGRYAAVGSLGIIFGVLLIRLFETRDIGFIAGLSALVVAGFVNVWCSPFSGPPERVIIRRKLRWAILGLGVGVSSLYGFLFTDAQVPAAFWGAVALAIAYWLFVEADWDATRDEIADLQSDTRTDWG